MLTCSHTNTYHTVKNFGEFGKSQFTKFFANIPAEACGHAVCVVNVRHVKEGT